LTKTSMTYRVVITENAKADLCSYDLLSTIFALLSALPCPRTPDQPSHSK
jgi:hypothetical protein